MPTVTPSLFGRITAVQRDHAALLEMVAKVRSLQGALSNGSIKLGATEVGLVGDFGARLRAHFVAEEVDGYFGTLVRDRPSLLPRVDSLRAEHGEMTEAVAGLGALSVDAIDARAFAARLGQLLDRFQAHEHRENLLVQEFLLQDEGVACE